MAGRFSAGPRAGGGCLALRGHVRRGRAARA
jgi:hypothetical protein